MKILLTTLNSKYVHMNLALRYLFEAAILYSNEIKLQEFTINNDDDYIYTEIVNGEYELVCFSCYIWNIERIIYLSENIKKANPNIKIVLGGPEVSFDREEMLSKYNFIDGIIVGDGEVAFKELCRTFLETKDIKTNEVFGISNENVIPFPYSNIEIETDKTVYYEASRGCPYRCSYCLSSVEKSIRGLPINRVLKELDFFLSKNLKQVKFIDRTFNWDEARCYDIIEYIIKNDNGVTNFHFEMCADTISHRLISLIEKARIGLLQFEIGVQSTNEDTLLEVSRTSNFKIGREKIKKIIEIGNVHMHLDLIAGLPFEDYESFIKSFNDTYSLNPEALQIGFLKMLKGTSIRESYEKHGYVFRSKAPYEVISNSYISSLELIRIKKVETVFDLYYNKGGFKETIIHILNNYYEDAFLFYKELSDYYYIKGHQHKSHKKEDLYRILLGWCDLKRIDAEEMRVILLNDMRNTLNAEAVKNFERKGFYTL